MAPRRKSHRSGPMHRPLNQNALRGVAVTEVGPDGDEYQVQRVGPSPRVYTCPACLQQVGPGVDHIVAWPIEAPFGMPEGVGARRHWHSECWGRKLRPAR